MNIKISQISESASPKPLTKRAFMMKKMMVWLGILVLGLASAKELEINK
jgi:hypothetical protein